MQTLEISRTVSLGYDEALAKTREALGREGFGVLTEIDMRAKLKEKLGVDFDRYMILGACSPPAAYKALQANPDVGLLLPCNVIVREKSPGQTIVAAIDPNAMMSVLPPHPALEAVANDVRAKLQRAIDAV